MCSESPLSFTGVWGGQMPWNNMFLVLTQSAHEGIVHVCTIYPLPANISFAEMFLFNILLHLQSAITVNSRVTKKAISAVSDAQFRSFSSPFAENRYNKNEVSV